MPRKYETVAEDESLVFQFEVGLDTKPSFDSKVTYNRSYSKNDVFGIEGLNMKCTTIQTLVDSSNSKDKSLQTAGLSYKKKIGIGEISVSGTVIGDKAVSLQFMLKQGPLSFGGEVKVDLTDPSKFLDNGLYLVTQFPLGHLDIVMKFQLYLFGEVPVIKKVIIQVRKNLKQGLDDDDKRDGAASCCACLVVASNGLVENEIFNRSYARVSDRVRNVHRERERVPVITSSRSQTRTTRVEEESESIFTSIGSIFTSIGNGISELFSSGGQRREQRYVNA